IDIANKIWTPVFATGDGIVSFVGAKRDFGTVIEINHSGSGYETLYAHLHQTAVVEGHPVKRGELIGYLGNSGRSTGPHLHYEVKKMGRNVNPMNFILPVETVVN
ncbi:MAG: peptidoglycan DD-metalloendopeptidase family protein, partial [Chitinivibrionales bacterium]|nr:peptidoglycan DD-metalloendopeptidase family protein [Chitinivibrionales bacterium]